LRLYVRRSAFGRGARTAAAIEEMTTPKIALGREFCGDPHTAAKREWLLTNGIGGFAGGTVGDVLTRRYHGLLFAALKPPLERTLLLAKLDAVATYSGHDYPLCANRWADGALVPHGYREIERFVLDGSIPTWTYAIADALLERTVWMEHGENTTYVRYSVRRANTPLSLSIRALVNARDYHSLTHAYDAAGRVAIDGRSAEVRMYDGAPVLYLTSDGGDVNPGSGWHYGFRLEAESERGLDDLEDHYNALDIVSTLVEGESLTVIASTLPHAAGRDTVMSLQSRAQRDRDLLAAWRTSRPSKNPAPPWITQLILAADQFVVERPTAAGAGQTLIAGYPWFGDWGRDTMIALPGLALVTGRPEVARNILTTFAQFLDRGMLPNRFPDAGEAPEYNTVDATLWFVEAIRRYVEATGDLGLAAQLLPAIGEIVRWHCAGTRYNIHVDENDGLLYAGEEGVQLTWMDAKVGDDVVTPRIGKPVEINALWYRALRTATAIAERNNAGCAAEHRARADRVRESFGRFWNEDAGYCYDVIDGPAGDDASIRPNAVIAASLPGTPLSLEQRKSIVTIAARTLLTPFGLRSLSPDDPRFIGRYGGNPRERDHAYHQGTVWPWLIGPFVSAHLSAFGDREKALDVLSAIEPFMTAYGIGTIAEIAEGDDPFRARGCIAQAWSVSEVLRAWHDVESCGAAERVQL
jgi:predicted glycogen debranching enzyme